MQSFVREVKYCDSHRKILIASEPIKSFIPYVSSNALRVTVFQKFSQFPPPNKFMPHTQPGSCYYSLRYMAKRPGEMLKSSAKQMLPQSVHECLNYLTDQTHLFNGPDFILYIESNGSPNSCCQN